jgi:transcriptional regulator with XRE-family HTH domain
MIASRLRVERAKRGMSQQGLAELTTFVTQGRISLIERGMPPAHDEAAVISGVLGVSIAELFPELKPRRVPKQLRRPE